MPHRATALLLSWLAVLAAPIGAPAQEGALPPERSPAIAPYAHATARIVGEALVDDTALRRLAWLADHHPGRLAGTEELERAIEWVSSEMRRDGFDDVREEPVTVPVWVRGAESAQLVEPISRELGMLGLGMSVGTPPEGITAEVIVVSSFEELERKAEAARGRIVLFDVPFTKYGETVKYRSRGAAAAAKAGAVACLIRSIGPRSLHTPHTGVLSYEDGIPRIAAAALTLEDASMLHRMADRGERVVVRLRMEASTRPDAPSANVVAELRGRERPDEVVVLAAHLDSWDVGAGVTDDGGGCVAVWEAARLLARLGLRPRRTIRTVLFTNEENGLRGALAYRDAYAPDAAKHVALLEVDGGIYEPRGFGVTGSPEALDRVREIASLLRGIGADTVTEGGGGADIGPMMDEGVPGMDLRTEGPYFDVHHTPADSFDKVRPRDLALCVASVAVMAYVLADLEDPLPRPPGSPAVGVTAAGR